MPNARTGESRQSVPPHETPPADRRRTRALPQTLKTVGHVVCGAGAHRGRDHVRAGHHGNAHGEGAVAWAVSLNMLPYVAVPAYWVFGRTKFNGYVTKRRADIEETSPLVRELVARAGADGFLARGRSVGSDPKGLLEVVTRM